MGTTTNCTRYQPTWVDGARRYRAMRGPISHEDGTCDALFPGAFHDRDGRCLLAEGHEGAHVFRGRGPGRTLTREQLYQAERDEKRRRARLALKRLRRERTAEIF